MKEWKGTAAVENIPAVTAFIDEQLEAASCSMKAQMQIDVAVDEVMANIAQYAYGDGTGEAAVRFELDEAERMVRITFADRGIPFNPLERPEPDVNLPAEERQIGGLGIFLVRKTMDGVAYRYEDGQNLLTLQKKI